MVRGGETFYVGVCSEKDILFLLLSFPIRAKFCLVMNGIQTEQLCLGQFRKLPSEYRNIKRGNKIPN